MIRFQITVILVVLFAMTLNSQSHHLVQTDYTITYRFTYSTNPETGEKSRGDSYVLFGGNETSYFLTYNDYFRDSIAYEFETKYGPPQENMTLANKVLFGTKTASSASNLRAIKNLNENTAKVILPKIGLHTYMVTPIDFKWIITTETDSILNFLCYKASVEYGGRSYDVWFTPEIPVSDGPYVFKGLPELILLVEDCESKYLFLAEGISTLGKEIHLNNNYMSPANEEISRKEYIDEAIKMKNNPSFAPGMRNVTPEMKLRLKKNYEKRYDLLIEKR